MKLFFYFLETLALFVMNFCFAVALPLLQQTVGALPLLSTVGIRMTGAGILLLGAQYAWNRKAFTQSLNWKLLLRTSFITLYFLCIAELWALSSISATKSSLIWALLPLITALCISWHAQEKLGYKQWAAIGIGMVGMGLLITADQPMSLGSLFTGGLPDLVMLSAVCAAAYGYLLLQQLAQEGHHTIIANGIMMLMAGGMCFITSICTGELWEPHAWWPALLYIALVMVIVNGIGLSLQLWLLRKNPVTLVALSSFLTPLYGIGIGVLVLQEAWHTMYGYAALCIGCGLYMLHQSR